MSRPTKDFPRDELAALLGDASVPLASILDEMRCAGAEPLAEPDLAAGRTVLGVLRAPEAKVEAADVEKLPPVLRAVALDAAIAARHLPLIETLAQSTDKTVAKDAKRAVHALRSRGVQVEVPKAVEAAPVVTAPTGEQPRAWLSFADPAGERLVFIVQPARGGVDVAEVVLSDEAGVVDAHAAALTRKEWKRFVDRLEARDGILLAEVPRNYARWLVCAAVDRADRRSLPIPPSFRSASFVLGPSVPAQPSPGRTLPVPSDADARAAGTAFLSHPALARWSLPDAEHRKIPSDSTDARREAIRAYWSATVRTSTAERLFDVAWILKHRGDSTHAEDVLSAAVLLDSGAPIEAIALTTALFDRPPLAPAPLPAALRSLLASP